MQMAGDTSKLVGPTMRFRVDTEGHVWEISKAQMWWTGRVDDDLPP